MEQHPTDAVHDLRALTERAAALWPDKTGLTFDETDERLSFRDIDRRSNAIGNALRALGVASGDRVAIMLRNRPEFPLTWLGCAKIGAISVPINVFYKSVDAGYLLTHSEARAIVTSDEFVPLIDSIEDPRLRLAHIILVDGDGGGKARDLRELLVAAADSPPPVTVVPEQLVNIQYTSGTAGRPKGCMLSHNMWMYTAQLVAREAPGLSDSDVIITSQPYYYGDAPWNTATALLSGAELVVLDRFHPSSFWQKVRSYRVTWFYCLGVMPVLLMKMPCDPDERDHQLRSVYCSGIPTKLHRAIEERWGVPWYDIYGMTEFGFASCEQPAEYDRFVGTACIGRATTGRELRVVGEGDRLVPRGEVGQLLVRGPGLMDGYHRNPEATATTFANGWVHTGDLVRMDEDGRLFFVGRQKDMIRRSGENISTAEVEEVIGLHPGVRMAACVPVPDEIRGEEVKAYVVLEDDIETDAVPPADLIGFCAERLAYFKVPRYWTFREDLPRTPSERVMKEVLVAGETDRRAGACDRTDEVWR